MRDCNVQLQYYHYQIFRIVIFWSYNFILNFLALPMVIFLGWNWCNENKEEAREILIIVPIFHPLRTLTGTEVEAKKKKIQMVRGTWENQWGGTQSAIIDYVSPLWEDAGNQKLRPLSDVFRGNVHWALLLRAVLVTHYSCSGFVVIMMIRILIPCLRWVGNWAWNFL